MNEHGERIHAKTFRAILENQLKLTHSLGRSVGNGHGQEYVDGVCEGLRTSIQLADTFLIGAEVFIQGGANIDGRRPESEATSPAPNPAPAFVSPFEVERSDLGVVIDP